MRSISEFEMVRNAFVERHFGPNATGVEELPLE